MQFEVGAVVEGKVMGITNFGAFIDIGEGKTGMIHVSEISTTYVREIRDYIKEGDTVKAKIISIDANGKISLSIKRLLPPPTGEKRPQRQFSSPRPRPAFNGVPDKVDWSGGASSLSFEEMMNKFKQNSEEKISDLKRNTDSKRGTSYRKR